MKVAPSGLESSRYASACGMLRPDGSDHNPAPGVGLVGGHSGNPAAPGRALKVSRLRQQPVHSRLVQPLTNCVITPVTSGPPKRDANPRWRFFRKSEGFRKVPRLTLLSIHSIEHDNRFIL